MNVLVTGGAGYLGSTLVPLLLAGGHRVRVLDSLMHGGESLLGVWNHPDFGFFRGDVRDIATVRQSLDSMDAVVHLAAIVGDPACARDPELARAVNLDASMALLDEIEKARIGRFLFASTCSNYGKMEDSTAYADEDSELRPVSLYAETKVAIEKEVLRRSENGTCCTALRFATIFGVSPRMRFDLTVNDFTATLLVKKELLVFGEQFWRPYIHVRDAARGIRMVLESSTESVRGSVFNVGSTEQNHTKKDLVEMITPYAPDGRIEYVHKNEDPRDYRVSFARIEERLGYNTTRTVLQGIDEIVRLVNSEIISDYDESRYRN